MSSLIASVKDTSSVYPSSVASPLEEPNDIKTRGTQKKKSDLTQIRSTLTEKDIRKIFAKADLDPGRYSWRKPSENERIYDTGGEGEIVVFQYMFDFGMKLPFQKFVRILLGDLNVVAAQVGANSWLALCGFMIRCREIGGAPSLGLFSELFHVKGGGRNDFCHFSAKKKLFDMPKPPKLTSKSRFFFLKDKLLAWGIPLCWNASKVVKWALDVPAVDKTLVSRVISWRGYGSVDICPRAYVKRWKKLLLTKANGEFAKDMCFGDIVPTTDVEKTLDSIAPGKRKHEGVGPIVRKKPCHPHITQPTPTEGEGEGVGSLDNTQETYESSSESGDVSVNEDASSTSQDLLAPKEGEKAGVSDLRVTTALPLVPCSIPVGGKRLRIPIYSFECGDTEDKNFDKGTNHVAIESIPIVKSHKVSSLTSKGHMEYEGMLDNQPSPKRSIIEPISESDGYLPMSSLQMVSTHMQSLVSEVDRISRSVDAEMVKLQWEMVKLKDKAIAEIEKKFQRKHDAEALAHKRELEQVRAEMASSHAMELGEAQQKLKDMNGRLVEMRQLAMNPDRFHSYADNLLNSNAFFTMVRGFHLRGGYELYCGLERESKDSSSAHQNDILSALPTIADFMHRKGYPMNEDNLENFAEIYQEDGWIPPLPVSSQP